MSVEVPVRSLPADISEQVHEIEFRAITVFNARSFNDSRILYQQILDLIIETQERIGRPIHKGAPLHMIGICYSGENNHLEAIRYITLAYIEDTLNVGYQQENEADNTPAGRMLRNFYRAPPDLLNDIKETVQDIKRRNQWPTILDPNQILSQIRPSIVPPPQVLETPETIPFGFPEPWDNRVFIGGSYHQHMAVIRYIENVVRSLGYTPVVAFDIDTPREMIHHHTLLLLHTCKYAIFEVSSPAGQLMEIERTIDYETPALCLYSGLSEDARPSQYVSSMLRTMNIRLEGYAEFSEINPIIRDFLVL